jgi:hypothetical protein
LQTKDVVHSLKIIAMRVCQSPGISASREAFGLRARSPPLFPWLSITK